MGSAKKVFNGIIWTVLLNVVNAVYGFISVPILLNYFGKSEYGLIGLAMSVNVYMQLMDMGLNSTNVRFFSEWLAKGDIAKTIKLFRTSVAFYSVVGLINAVILAILAFFSYRIFNVTPEQNETLRTLLLILTLSAFGNWISSCFDQMIKASENVAWIQRRAFIPKIVQLAALVLTVILKLNLVTYFILTSFAIFLIIPLSVRKIKEILDSVNFFPLFDKETFKEILPYSLNVFAATLLQFSFYSLKPIMLGVQGTVEDVADYKILSSIIGLVNMVGVSFLGALLPSTIKAVSQGNVAAFNKVAYDSTKFITIALSICIFGMMSIDTELIELYVGVDYSYLIPWINLSLLALYESHTNGITSIILSGDNLKPMTVINSVAALIGLVLLWFLIPLYNIGGVVIPQLIYSAIQIAFTYFFYMPRLNISRKKVFFRFIPYVAICSLTAFLICSLNFDVSNTIIRLVLKGMAFLVISVFFIILTLTKNEYEYIKSILPIPSAWKNKKI